MIDKYRGGVIPPGRDAATDEGDAEDLAEYHASMNGENGYLLHEALKSLWRTISRANEFVDRQAPWKLAADEGKADELDRTLGSLARQLVRQCVHIAPFTPDKAEELWRRLGAPGSVHAQRFATLAEVDPAGWQVAKGSPLFPREAK